MPTAELTFPKVGGDPYYYSEANRFAGAGQFIAMGSTRSVGSGANQRINAAVGSAMIMGSYLILAGSLSNPAHIYITALHNSADISNQSVLFISGQSANVGISAGSGVNSSRLIEAEAIIGSATGFTGLLKLFVWNAVNSTTNTGEIESDVNRFSTNTINGLHTGSNLVIFFGENFTTPSTNSSGTIPLFSIQSFRGGL